MGATDHRVDALESRLQAVLDGFEDSRQRMLVHQLQESGELAGAVERAVLTFQSGAKRGETRRQGPVAKHRRMVQRSWLAFQGGHVVERVENHRVPLVRTHVRRDDRPAPPRRLGPHSPSHRPSQRRDAWERCSGSCPARRFGTCRPRPRGESRRRRTGHVVAPPPRRSPPRIDPRSETFPKATAPRARVPSDSVRARTRSTTGDRQHEARVWRTASAPP